MGETGIHVNATTELFLTLKWLVFRHRKDVYVAASTLLYYEEGNPTAVKTPDIMVIKGVSHPEERMSFKLWVENRVPSLVFEVTSKKSRKDDFVVKMELYTRLGVLEYFLFDPLGEYLKPRFQAYRLVGVRYEPIAPEANGDVIGPELGLGLRVVGTRVRLIDPANGRLIPDDINEIEDAGRDAAVQKYRREIDEERLKAEALTAEIKRLRALLGEG